MDACPGAEKDAKLRIEVLGPTEGQSQEDVLCHRDWDFVQGAVIEGTIVDLSGEGDCKAGVLDSPGIGDWDWQIVRGGRIIGGHTLETQYEISNGACAALLRIIVEGEDSAYCEIDGDKRCGLRFQTSPHADPSGLCPDGCGGRLDVVLERQ